MVELTNLYKKSKPTLHKNRTPLSAFILSCWFAGSNTGNLPGSFTESIAEFDLNDLKVLHAAGTGGLPPLSFDRPVVVSEPFAGVATLSTTRLLNVIRRAATTPAQRVGFIVPFSKT